MQRLMTIYAAQNIKCLLQEVTLRVRGVDAPPVVDEYVEDAQCHNEERGRPLRLKADSYHDARSKTDDRHKEPGNTPLSAEDEADEQEDEENTSREQEAKVITRSDVCDCDKSKVGTHYFLRSFSDSVGRPAKSFLREYIESLKTINRPPMTLRFRRKKLRSKIRP